MSIPFVDLKKQYFSIQAEVDQAIKNVISETAFIQGEYVSQFERDFRIAYGVNDFVSCANGTDAIYIVLKSLGIGPGDEVITVANSWISTSETITQAGAKPVFVDIDPLYYTIDVEKIEEKITSRTKAIIPVHLFGQACDMDTIQSICKKHSLFLVEDCAQAHFAEWRGQKVGTFGDAGTFSFFPGKNLGAYGDAGGIVTNSIQLGRKMRMYSHHGALVKHRHEIEGINSRLDGIQAAILSVKLKYIDEWTDLRISRAAYYNDILMEVKSTIVPKANPQGKHVYHLYVVRVQHRDILQKKFRNAGIETGIHYPTPLPFLDAYKYLGHTKEDFPVSFENMNNILSLPIYPELSFSEIDKIKSIISDDV